LIGFIAVCVTIGQYEVIPFPYSKVPYGLAIGAINIIICIGLIFLLSRPKLPSFLIVAGFTLMQLSITSSFDWDASVWPITTVISRQSLILGSLMGILWLYWASRAFSLNSKFKSVDKNVITET